MSEPEIEALREENQKLRAQIKLTELQIKTLQFTLGDLENELTFYKRLVKNFNYLIEMSGIRNQQESSCTSNT